MLKLIREADVPSLLPMSDAIAAVEAALAELASERASNRPRQRVPLASGLLHVMPASLPSRGMAGLKAYTSVRNGQTRFHVLLYDVQSGRLAAIIEADRLGQIRTGAATGVATKYLAAADASTLAVVGTGWQARSQVEAVVAVRPICRVRAFGRDPERRARFCREVADVVRIPVEPAASARDAVEGADIVVTATTSRDPVVQAEWIAPGTLVNAVGSNQLGRRELDPELLRRASLVVVDSRAQARHEAGDLVPLIEAGTLAWESLLELGDVIIGKVPRPENGIAVFKSLGLAIEDVAVGSLVYERAIERGIGEELPM
jgi:alanine dehydrogenase